MHAYIKYTYTCVEFMKARPTDVQTLPLVSVRHTVKMTFLCASFIYANYASQVMVA